MPHLRSEVICDAKPTLCLSCSGRASASWRRVTEQQEIVHPSSATTAAYSSETSKQRPAVSVSNRQAVRST